MHSTIRLAAAGLAAVGIMMLGVTAASATISPTTTYTSDGVAGYYAAPNANRLGNGDHVTGVRSTFELSPAMENNTIQVGVELCRAQSLTTPVTAAAVVYAQWNTTTKLFDIFAGHTASSNCLAALGGVSGSTMIDAIPEGDLAQLEITVSPHHIVTFTDSDETTLTGASTTFGGFTFGFDRAGAGTNGDPGILTAPASNLLTAMDLTAARDQSGWALFNRSNLTRLVVNKVTDTTTGDAAGQVLITAGPIGTNSGNFNLLEGDVSGP